MSNFLAVATVTATLRRLLTEAVQAEVPGADVTTVRPADGQNSGAPADLGINIFLYQVMQNPAWRNDDLPTRTTDGQLKRRPQAALNLHYLFSYYGAERTLEPQRLLGSSVTFLHSRPTITRADVQATVTAPDAPFLSGSDLGDQVDLVRLTPLALSLEEMSRLWAVFLQTRYVLSVAYQASVVLLERQLTVRPTLPTRAFNLSAIPLRHPFIRRVISQAGEAQPIVEGSALSIEGIDLQGELTQVEIDGSEVPLDDVRTTAILLTLRPGLRAGLHQVQVRQGLRMGAPDVAHMTLASNLGAFALQPEILSTNGVYDVTVTPAGPAGDADVALGVRPAIGTGQQVTLELLDPEGLVHTFAAEPHPAATTHPTFAVRGLTPGDYFVRVRVDGAESPFELDADRAPVAPRGQIP